MSFLVRTAITVAQIVVAFYGFWFVWRVLLPALPGPDDPDDRIAPYAWYFTDPLVDPIAQRLGVHPWPVSAVYLLLVAGAQVGLAVVTTFV